MADGWRRLKTVSAPRSLAMGTCSRRSAPCCESSAPSSRDAPLGRPNLEAWLPTTLRPGVSSQALPSYISSREPRPQFRCVPGH